MRANFRVRLAFHEFRFVQSSLRSVRQSICLKTVPRVHAALRVAFVGLMEGNSSSFTRPGRFATRSAVYAPQLAMQHRLVLMTLARTVSSLPVKAYGSLDGRA